MSDVKVERKVTMARKEAARWVADLAEALAGEGRVTIRLAGSTVEMDVPDEVRCEAEVEVDGDEVELEFELKWSTAEPASGRAHANGSTAS
ncbi:amphi-Trp domain-containing protein [Trujillonella endophytica]|uniref:Amphi-Trp domain-containing protein n=1 Tax=Trujillonella endophytica TaxID=673521 RepID=A0A1H8QNI0_9ACTN|nr:amphi-Trp domain-containing protein [Trujillella endophytica]SEO55760.1 amphi-Trp domain-containing protein [Trujillella endophytica]